MPTFGLGKVNGVDRNTSKHNVIARGGATLSTVQSKFGGSSLRCGANYTGCEIQAGLRTGNDGTIDTSIMSRGDFTLECWWRADTFALNTGGTSANYLPSLAGSYEQSSSAGGFNRGWTWCFGSTTRIDFTQGGVGPNSFTVPTLAINTWYHTAVVRTGTTIYLFHNGTRYTPATTRNWTTVSTAPVRIGHTFANTHNDSLFGYVDEFRISNSVRYTGATYTIPTNPFDRDVNTVVLLHFDGPDGSTSIEDSAVF
jgi:hypothetical protein